VIVTNAPFTASSTRFEKPALASLTLTVGIRPPGIVVSSDHHSRCGHD
jgi:hypothetical protein